jgi:large subunit ribosomal protein L7/L12
VRRPPWQAAAAPPAACGGPAAEEKTSFTSCSRPAGDKKIQVIKEVRAITGRASRRPRTWSTARSEDVKEGLSKDEAAAMKKQLEDAGAKVKLV